MRFDGAALGVSVQLLHIGPDFLPGRLLVNRQLCEFLGIADADELVGQSIEQLSTSFSEARNKLEGQWDRGDDVSTEDLRLALQKYRSFFNRLLSI